MSDTRPASRAALAALAASDHDCPGIHECPPAPHFACRQCTWHGRSPDLRAHGGRVCPGCGGAVSAFDSLAAMLRIGRSLAEVLRMDPAVYEAIARWGEGKSFPDGAALRAAYWQAMAGPS